MTENVSRCVSRLARCDVGFADVVCCVRVVCDAVRAMLICLPSGPSTG